jgi:hypothetical protein
MKEEEVKSTDHLGWQPAFPSNGRLGMSQRLYLAGMAMQGLLAGGTTRNKISDIISDSLTLADELLKQEAK